LQLRVEQLEAHLQRQLAPIYLISGDEPLQRQEATDSVRARARENGFEERIVFDADRGFDWNSLMQEADAMSLFGERKILELRLPTGKPGDGAKILTEYASRAPDDRVLLITSGKIDKGGQATKWYKALASTGVTVAVWPKQPNELADWIGGRMRRAGLEPTPGAVSLLVERVEGNMLAARQEIDKIALLHNSGRIDEDIIVEVVSDSARFNLFGMVDVVLAGELERVLRMLNGLQGEGVEPVLINWALSRELRTLITLLQEAKAGRKPAELFRAYRIWDKRQPIMRAALRRHRAAALLDMLQHSARIDRIIKGRATGKVWDELVQLAVEMAGGRNYRLT